MPDIRGEEIKLNLGSDAFEEDTRSPIMYTYCAECARDVLIKLGHNIEPVSNIRGLDVGQQINTFCVICKNSKCISWDGQTISQPTQAFDERGAPMLDKEGNMVYHGHGDCEHCLTFLRDVPDLPDLPGVCEYWYVNNADKIPEIIANSKAAKEEKQLSPEELEAANKRRDEEQAELDAMLEAGMFDTQDVEPDLPDVTRNFRLTE